MADYLAPIVAERQANPGGDLFSLMVNIDVDGQKISLMDAVEYCRTVLVAELDTAAAMLA